MKYAGERQGNENQTSPEYDDLHVEPALVILCCSPEASARGSGRVREGLGGFGDGI